MDAVQIHKIKYINYTSEDKWWVSDLFLLCSAQIKPKKKMLH